MILFEIARQEQVGRDVIIRNFLARTDMMVNAVFRLWDIKDYQDCWILHRCLIDRLFHLSHLHEHDQFDIFESWSFLEQYKAVSRVLADPDVEGARGSELAALTAEQKERAKALLKSPPVWRRPKAEEVAKKLNMRFLYRYGYDFASTHVHPMANDGQQDFFTITKLEPTPDFPDQRSLLSNTILVGTMITQQGLNASTLSWRAILYDFLDELLGFLDTGSNSHRITFLKLGKMFEQRVPLCQARRQ